MAVYCSVCGRRVILYPKNGLCWKHRGTTDRVPYSLPVLPVVIDWAEPDPDEHTCHVHPLGSTEVERYWCGHTCLDPVCRKYLAVWLVLHPLALFRKFFDRGSR